MWQHIGYQLNDIALAVITTKLLNTLRRDAENQRKCHIIKPSPMQQSYAVNLFLCQPLVFDFRAHRSNFTIFKLWLSRRPHKKRGQGSAPPSYMAVICGSASEIMLKDTHYSHRLLPMAYTSNKPYFSSLQLPK